MRNRSISLQVITFSFLSSSVFASVPVKLHEAQLKEYVAKGSPSLDEIQAVFLSSELRNKELREDISPELYGRASYRETNEKPIIPFIPIFSPVKLAELGVRQKLAHGFSVGAAAGTQQQSAVSASGKYRDVTITNINFTVQMDLWRDLFGRATKAKLKNASDENKRADLEQQIQKKAFLISLRKTYWALVANNESMKISRELLKYAQAQSEETVRRFRNSVAEQDEVARYKAQVASRTGTLTSLEYQKQGYTRQLKTLLPELSDADISLADYDLDKTLKDVLTCTEVIASESKIPYQNTLYDESISLLTGMLSNNRTINERYADTDVSLFGRVQSVGVSSDPKLSGFKGSYGGSWDDMMLQNRTGYEVGLNVTVPLGDAKASTQRTKELYDEKRLRAFIGRTEANVITSHQEILKTITLLNQVIESQRINTEQLNKRLLYMRKKYQQARASVNDLVQDQDALLSSELITIDTKLAVLNVILDYLAVYTETPCDFNRI
jgi:outer membrane protein TolC